jgi:hypothetical protein
MSYILVILGQPESNCDSGTNTMPPLQRSDAWSDLSKSRVNRRLRGMGLILCELDGVLICSQCKYALQPSGETVSKHLWEKHRMPAKERSGLNLPDPNSVLKRPNGDPAHPHLLVQSGFSCLQCEYHTTSQTLLKRHLPQEHGLQLSSKSTYNDRCWSQVTL